MAKKKCDFRMPAVEKIDGTPYKDRYVLYCACGTTIFGNTRAECESTWRKHADGKLRT